MGTGIRPPHGRLYHRCMAKKNALDWQLAPAPESKDHVRIDPECRLFINGTWVRPTSGNYVHTITWVIEVVFGSSATRQQSIGWTLVRAAARS